MSTNGIFVKHLAPVIPIQDVVALRFILTFAAIAFLAKAFRKTIKTSRMREELLMGFLSGLAILLYFISISTIGLSLSVILLYTAPVFASIASHRLVGERLTGGKVFWILAALAGIGLIVKPGFSLEVGIMAAFLSGVFYGLKMSLNRLLGTTDSAWTMTYYTLLVPTVFSLAYLLSSADSFVVPNGVQWVYIAGLVFFPTVLGFLAQHKGLALIETSKGSVLLMSEAVMASIWGILLYSESFDGLTVLGCIIVFISAFSLNRTISSKK